MKTASKGSRTAGARGCGAPSRARCSPQVPLSRSPLALHRLHVLRPLVDERDVVPGLGQEPADDAADGARADDADPRL